MIGMIASQIKKGLGAILLRGFIQPCTLLSDS